MPSYREWITERERTIKDLQASLNGRVQSVQGRLYRQLVRLTAELETDSLGRLSRGNSVPGFQRKINRIFDRYKVNVKRGIIPYMVRGLLRLIGVNSSYFESFNRFNPKKVKDVATRRYLQQLGYSTTTGEIKKDSWLDGLTASLSAKISVMRRFSAAILAGLTLRDFSRNFEQDFLGNSGLSLQRHWSTHTSTLFISLDRNIQQYYARELKLEYYVYSGTIKGNTREFCRQRVGRVYTATEIRKWNALQWRGKIIGSDVFSTLGGYQCRHILSAVSEKIALRLAKTRGGVNTYDSGVILQ